MKSILSNTLVHFSSSLPTYKTKDFEKLLLSKGFSFHHQTGSHRIYLNSDNYQVVLPFKGKEVNSMMAKVILERISRGNLIKYQG